MAYSTTQGKGRLISLFAPSVLVSVMALNGCNRGTGGFSPEVTDAVANVEGFTIACQDRRDISIASSNPTLSSLKTVDYLPGIGVAVSDNVEKRIFVFDTAGTLLRSVGQPGGMRGEFRYIADAILSTDLTVYAVDDVNGLTSFPPGRPSSNILSSQTLSSARWLGHLDSTDILLGQDQIRSGRTVIQAYEIRAFNPLTGSLRPLVAQVDSAELPQGASFFRGLRMATDLQATRIAVATPLALEFSVHDRHGRLIGHWSGTSPMYNALRPLTERLEGRPELMKWVMSSSHVTSIALPHPDTVLIGWESFREGLRHYYVGAAVVGVSELLWTIEVPFRPTRSTHGSMVFVDSRKEPAYELIVCGRFAAGHSRLASAE